VHVSDDAPVPAQLNLVVRDMDATVDFYRRLGLTIADTDPAWQQHHRNATTPEGFDLDFDSEAFAQMWNGGWVGRPGGMGVLGFRMPTRASVDERYAELTAAGYTGQQPPYDTFWGSRFAVVEDPDGNAVGLMSEPDPARRSETPAPPSSPEG
jgi:catechol 2,3-dioxygenase-like lactoylglutathione lyase family enzyme